MTTEGFRLIGEGLPVYKVHKDENYTTISNTHLRDSRLTLKAKGLMTLVLSLSPDWNYSITGLAAICKEGTTAVKAALKELKECGYLTITKLPPTKGNSTFEYLYEFYEEPLDTDSLGVENLPVENLPLENLQQLNTDNKSTEGLNTRESKRSRFQNPTIEELKSYAQEMGYQHFDANHFHDYYEANGWKVGRNPMKDWKAAVRNWVSRDSQDNVKEPSAPLKTDDRCHNCGGKIYHNRQTGRYDCSSCLETFPKSMFSNA